MGLLHTLAPDAEVAYPTQGEHDVMPEKGENVPIPQERHVEEDEAPTLVENEPATQERHVEEDNAPTVVE